MQTWLDWAAQGQSFPAIEEAIDYLNTHAPKNEHSGLVWNDSRMGNTMFADDLSVAAFFDFEVSSLGPAEIDLAWWLYCEDLFSIQFGIKRLAGIPQGEEAVRGFERIYGRPMPEFDYRSEEHTSELQSLMRNSYAVFRLKKKIYKQHRL